jgi:hypothetical protein
MVRIKTGKGAMKTTTSSQPTQPAEGGRSLNVALRISVLDTNVAKARIAGLLGLMKKQSVVPDARCSLSLSWRKLYENIESYSRMQVLEGLTVFESYLNLKLGDGSLPPENREQLASSSSSLSDMLSVLRGYAFSHEISNHFGPASQDLSDEEATAILEKVKTVVSTSKTDLQELLPMFPTAGKGQKQLMEFLMINKANANKYYLELVHKALNLVKEILQEDLTKVLAQDLQERKKRDRQVEEEDTDARPAPNTRLAKNQKKKKNQKKDESAVNLALAVLNSEEDTSEEDEDTPLPQVTTTRRAPRATRAATKPQRTKETLKCPGSLVKQVVGVRNCVRNMIEKETGAKIEIDEERNPCLVHITGSRECVENASQIVGKLIKDLEKYGDPHTKSSKAMITIRESVYLALEDPEYTIPVIVPKCFQQDCRKALTHFKRKLREKRNHR